MNLNLGVKLLAIHNFYLNFYQAAIKLDKLKQNPLKSSTITVAKLDKLVILHQQSNQSFVTYFYMAFGSFTKARHPKAV